MSNWLPDDIQADDIYFLVTTAVSLVVLLTISKNLVRTNKFAGRVKALQERRAHYDPNS